MFLVGHDAEEMKGVRKILPDIPTTPMGSLLGVSVLHRKPDSDGVAD